MKFANCAIIAVFIWIQCLPANAVPYNAEEQLYLKNVQNLTRNAELEEFFAAQSSIYIDNVYGVYQRFYYSLLSELPRSIRRTQLKQLVDGMDSFLELEDFRVKVEVFENFIMQHAAMLTASFEYDAIDTLLTAAQFNEIYVRNNIEDVMNYANIMQMRQFVAYMGNAIRYFLVFNRPQLDKPKMLTLKASIDEFLEADSFLEKCLFFKLFLRKCAEFLE